tara:strand:+ start:71 stop:418 length:348 start_codon:yes stop_codon:yes gene_type:complete
MRPKLIISPRFCKLISIFINVGAITLYPFIIARKPLGITTYNHESIHIVQQRELYIIGFYILYVWYWLKARFKGLTGSEAYYAIPFEKEAYKNEKDLKYIKTRERHAWKNYRKDE